MATDELTAEQIDKTIKAVREEGELSQRTHGIGLGFGEYVAGVIIMLRADRDRLREEIAAKDAIFRAMHEFDGDPWTHGSADLGWNQVALSFICEWCHVSIDGNWPLRGVKPPHPDNGCPRNAIVAAPADEGKTCAPMEEVRGKTWATVQD